MFRILCKNTYSIHNYLLFYLITTASTAKYLLLYTIVILCICECLPSVQLNIRFSIIRDQLSELANAIHNISASNL